MQSVNLLVRTITPFIIVAAIITVFVLGLSGTYEVSRPGQFNIWGAVYSVLAMFLMDVTDPFIPNWKLGVARYIAALILGYGIFVTIYNYLHRGWIVMKIKYLYKNHVIVCGAGSIGHRIATELLRFKFQVVVIEKDPKNEHIERITELGGLVLKGSALEKEFIKKSGIAKASTCIIATGHDESNLEVAMLLCQLNEQQFFQHYLRVLMHIDNWHNNSFLKDYLDLYTKTPHFDIDPFNTNAAAAQLIYDNFPPLRKVSYRWINKGSFIPQIEASENVIAIVGFNDTAEAFIMENIILSHGPGLRNLKILLISSEVHKDMRRLRQRFPFMEEYIDLIPVELENENFYGLPFSSDTFKEHLQKLNSAYFFGEDDAFLMGLAGRFRQLLYTETGDLNQVALVVCLPENSNITELVAPHTRRVEYDGKEKKPHLFATLSENFNIRVIELITDTCTKAKLIDEAGVVNALSKTINYFYSVKYEFEWLLDEKDRKRYSLDFITHLEQKFLSMKFSTTQPLRELEDAILTDLSFAIEKDKEQLRKVFGIAPRWNSLSDIKQDSNRYVARHLDVKVRFLEQMGHSDLTKEVIERYLKVFAPIEHKRWNAEKLAFKFRYGPFPKDGKTKKVLKDILKVHDQIIKYDELDKEMEDKDLNMFLLIPVLQGIKNIVQKTPFD